MRRPDFHLRRYQLWQMAGDGLLIALAYFLAFQLRFLDDPGTIPPPRTRSNSSIPVSSRTSS
jgi:hypothetical protein